MSFEVKPLFQVFPDIDGDPLESGYIYIGVEGQNPEVLANQIEVWWDEDLTDAATQPLRTLGGMISRNGTAAHVYVDDSIAAYSITVRNKNNSLIRSDLSFPVYSEFRNSISRIYLSKTVADMKNAAGITLVDGTVIDSAKAALVADLGTQLQTAMHNTTSKKGGATYELISNNERIARGLVGNDYTCIPLLGGTSFYAALIIDGEINAFKMGAIGNGVANDTLAIQATLDCGAGKIYIPAGTFVCGRLNLLAMNPSGITLCGDGKTRTKILSTAAGDYSLYVFAVSGLNTSGVKVTDLWIDGNGVANEAYFYRNTNLVLDSIQVTNHVGKNCHIERSYQVNVRSSVFITYLAGAAECALYTATNAITIDGENYFQTEGSAPGIIVDELVIGANPPNCYGVVIKDNVFEVSTFGVQVAAGIDTAGFVFDDNYLELVGSTTAKGVQFSGGRHTNVSIKGNYFTEVITPVEILAVDSRSSFDIKNNKLHRPIIVTTSVGDTAKLAAYDLPAMVIENQDVTFANATYSFVQIPTVIVDQSFAFSSLSVEKVTAVGLNNAYNRVKGRSYYHTDSNTPTNLLTFYLPSGGGTAQAYMLSGLVNLMWRRGPQSLTGLSSTHMDRHAVNFAARNTGAGGVGDSILTVTTAGAAVSVVDTVVSGAGQTLAIQATGETGVNPNEWLMDFDVSYFQ